MRGLSDLTHPDTGMATTESESVQAFDDRLVMYGLDERARRIVAETWPVIAPSLDGAIEEILAATMALPKIRDIVTANRALLQKLEIAHFTALLGGSLGAQYSQTCRETVAQEAKLGFDARLRSTAGSYVLKAALAALARKYRFSPARVADYGSIVARVISFDVANAMTLHRQSAEQAALARRKVIDDAIADFASAIGDVV